MSNVILSFPTLNAVEPPSYSASLEPNAPLLILLDADRATTDVTVDLARRKLTVRGVANACRAAEAQWDTIRAEEDRQA